MRLQTLKILSLAIRLGNPKLITYFLPDRGIPLQEYFLLAFEYPQSLELMLKSGIRHHQAIILEELKIIKILLRYEPTIQDVENFYSLYLRHGSYYLVTVSTLVEIQRVLDQLFMHPKILIHYHADPRFVNLVNQTLTRFGLENLSLNWGNNLQIRALTK